MKIKLITESKDKKLGGLSRYEISLIRCMKGKVDFEVINASQIKKPGRVCQLANLLLPPKKTKDNGQIIHLLNQHLALSLNFVQIHNIVVTVHDLSSIVPGYFKQLPFVDRIRYRLVMKGLKRAERIIVDVPFTKNEVIKYLNFDPQKIDVVPLGIDHSLFKMKKLGRKREEYRHYPDSYIILYVGSEIPRMNFITLLKAFYELKKILPSVKLVKVGESKCPEERKKILSLINKLDLIGDVKFVEYVSEKDLANYYASADLFVYPIDYTGFGLPPLEAMACGCPVVCSDGSCLPEVVGDAALLFNPKNILQLRDCMYNMLTDKALRKKFVRKGLRHSKSFTWEKCAKQTINIYNKFLDDLR